MDEALDPFRITDKLEDVLLDVMVSRFEARGNHPFFQKVLREYLDAMRIDAATTVLDIGCGTGVAARTIARRKNLSGKVTGIDLSSYLVNAAERLADEEGVRRPCRVPLRGYTRSRHPRWQVRCRGSAHAPQPRGRGANGARGSTQSPQARRTDRHL